MSVGLPPDKPQLDSWSGTLARDMSQWCVRADALQTFLLATPDVDLQAAPYGYTPAEVALLKSGVGYMKQLADAYRAGVNHVFADKLGGLGTF